MTIERKGIEMPDVEEHRSDAATLSRPVLGLLPAAGEGMRLAPFTYPKELLPIGYYYADDSNSLRPRILIEDSLQNFAAAGIEMAMIVISPQKSEILKYLSSDTDRLVNLMYSVQSSPRGLADAVMLAGPWATKAAATTILGLPDTVVRPKNAYRVVLEKLATQDALLSLGVFPTDSPENFGPVEFDESSRVKNVWDKPSNLTIQNTWAIAAWKPSFYEVLSEAIRETSDDEVILGDVFDLIAKRGRAVASWFPDGSFLDFGSSAALLNVINGIDLDR